MQMICWWGYNPPIGLFCPVYLLKYGLFDELAFTDTGSSGGSFYGGSFFFGTYYGKFLVMLSMVLLSIFSLIKFAVYFRHCISSFQ